MVKVFFETRVHAQLVAIFEDEEVYNCVFPELEKLAKINRMFITESVTDANLQDLKTDETD